MHGLQTIQKLNDLAMQRSFQNTTHETIATLKAEVTRLATLLATTAADIEDEADNSIDASMNAEVDTLYAIASNLVKLVEPL